MLQAECAGECQRRAPADEMFGGGKVTIDEGVVGDAIGGGAGIYQDVDQLDLYAAILCDP